MVTVAATGHRPEKIQNEKYLRSQIKRFLEQCRVERAINGLASGVDLWYAFEAIKLDIPVVSARPWKTHGPRAADRRLYDFVIENSVEVVDVTDYDSYPGPWVYQKRNEWMVNHATKVFAVWDGSPGGTRNCFDYALGKKEIVRYREGYGWAFYDEAGEERMHTW